MYTFYAVTEGCLQSTHIGVQYMQKIVKQHLTTTKPFTAENRIDYSVVLC